MRPVILLIAGIVLTTELRAQAIQAARDRATSAESIRATIDSMSAVVLRRLARLDLLAGQLNERTDGVRALQAYAPLVTTQQQLAHDVLAARSSPELFFTRYGALRSYVEGIRPLTDQALDLRMPDLAMAAPSPVFKVPGVSFVAGVVASVGREHSPIVEFELSTNLLGAAAGTAFDAIGSPPLKRYFEDNLAVGTAFPFGSDGSISATVGIGLGELRLGHVRIWPAINVQQVDSSDARVPADVRTGHDTTANWSSPSLAMAVSPWGLGEIADRLAAGRLVPIVVLGLRLPYFYPDDPFAAVAALFSSKRSGYLQSGTVGFQVGVYFPLEGLQPVTGGTP